MKNNNKTNNPNNKKRRNTYVRGRTSILNILSAKAERGDDAAKRFLSEIGRV